MIMHDKKEKTSLLINIAIPDDLKINTKKMKSYEITKTWRHRSAGC